MSENDTNEARVPKPFFEQINSSNLLIQVNPKMAQEISDIIIEGFEDGDSGAVWAFAKQLEAFSKRDSHAETPEYQSA